MAKGINTFQQLGKIDGRKYYRMKGVDGIISSNINTGMSNKVKNDAAYDNTRRNNSEFGMATSTAGAAVKSLSLRWRYLLIPFATAQAAKTILAAAKADTTAAWGSRAISPEALLATYPVSMQKVVKNDVSDFGNISGKVTQEEDVYTLHLTGEDLHNEKAEAAGCDGVRVVLIDGVISPSTGGDKDTKAVPASQQTEVLATQEVEFGGDLTLSVAAPLIGYGHAQSSLAPLGYAVLLPYRTINGEKVIMQEFASAKFIDMDIVD